MEAGARRPLGCLSLNTLHNLPDRVKVFVVEDKKQDAFIKSIQSAGSHPLWITQPVAKPRESLSLDVTNSVSKSVKFVTARKLVPVSLKSLEPVKALSHETDKDEGVSLAEDGGDGPSRRTEKILPTTNSTRAAEDENRQSQFLKPLVDIIAETNSRKSQSKVLKGTSVTREKQTRTKFSVHFKKPSISTMNAAQVEMPKCLEDILPSCHEYKVMFFKEQLDGFSAIVRTNIFDKEAALNWIEIFQEECKVDLRSKDTFKENSDRIVFKKTYRCHCNTRADELGSKTKKPHAKHTVCPANVIITVRNKNMKRSADEYLQSYPCEITVNHIHNHRINCADSLRHRRPSTELKSEILGMFDRQHSPASLLKSLKFKLQMKYGDDYFLHAANGSECPSYKWVYNLYHSTQQQKYGAPSGDEMIETLRQFISEYNTTCGSECAKLSIEGSDVLIAICSPLMKRAHEMLRSSGEEVFVDSSGNMDFQNTRLFLFVTSSVAGGIPLGIVFTTSEATFPLTKAFELLKDILPENAFYGRGKEGPHIFMTDDSDAERIALRTAFSAKDLILLLCKFHQLNAVWRYILDSKHGIQAPARPELYFLFKQLLDCPEISTFNSMFDEFLQSPIVQKHKLFKEHIEKKRANANEWAMAYRSELLYRGHDTNNINEVCTKCIKDEVLERVKAYNMVQLFDFIVHDLDAYFKRRITDCLSNRSVNYTSSRYYVPEEKLKSLSAKKVAGLVYEVCNSESKKTYQVDLTVDVCTCPIGRTGAPCKHQFFVVKSFGHSSMQFLPRNDPEAKMFLHKLMSGTTANVPNEWYENHTFTANSIRNDTNNNEENDNFLHTPRTEEPFGTAIGTGMSTPGTCNSEEVMSEETGTYATPAEEGSSSSGELAEAKLRCYERINRMVEDMKKRLEERSEVYLPAFDKFLDRYDECSKSENTYVSAMFTFNRAHGHVSLRANRMRRIPVQPTALGRRKLNFGGKQPKAAGRPQAGFRVDSQKRRIPEPNYAHLPSKKRLKAPHAITRCVMSKVDGRT